MNIFIISCVFSPEPVVSAAISYKLANYLAEQGHGITVICPPPTRPEGFLFDDQQDDKCIFKLIRTNSYTHPKSTLFGRLNESWSFGRKSYAAIKENRRQIDRIYMNTWPIFAQLWVSLACVRFRIPYFVHIQDVYPEALVNKLPSIIQKTIKNVFTPFDHYVLQKAAQVITISQDMRTYLSTTRNLPESKFKIVRNWQKFNAIAPQTRELQKADRLTFMYLGNIGPVAGLDYIIELFSYTKELDLVIAGSGSKKGELEALVRAKQLSNVSFRSVPSGAVEAVQSEADILLLPITKGGANSSIPSKLPAYMFSAKPVLGVLDTDSDSATTILNAACGWVTPFGELASALNTLSLIQQTSQEKLQTMGDSGKKYAEAYFSEDINLPLLANILTASL